MGNENKKWSDEEINSSREHIYYEVQMFLQTANLLFSNLGEPKDYASNVFLEVYILHFRIIYEFLTQYVRTYYDINTKENKEFKPRKNDFDLQNYFTLSNFNEYKEKSK